MLRAICRFAQQQSIGLLAIALVGAGGVDAATGGNVILGRLNRAEDTTIVRNTGGGPALDLLVQSGEAPLRVNSSALVNRFNAALLNGKRSSAFAPSTGSPNYLASGYIPILAASYSSPVLADGLRDLQQVNVIAPANGRVSALQWGNCEVTGDPGEMSVRIEGVGQTVELNAGLCRAEASLAVIAGQEATVRFDVTAGQPGSVELNNGNQVIYFAPD